MIGVPVNVNPGVAWKPAGKKASPVKSAAAANWQSEKSKPCSKTANE